MKITVVLGFAALTLASVNSMALTVNMKPGLWEHTFKFDGSSLSALQNEQQQQMQQAMIEMKKRFAEMPPEQRKQLEAMMKQNGIEVDTSALAAGGKVQLSKDGTVVKECVTQAQIDKGELPAPEKNCKNTIVQKSSNVFKVTYQCTGGSQAHGTTEVTFQNPKSYTGKASYSLGGAGNSQTMQGDMSGKWLSSDCGTIAPEADPVDDEDLEL